MNEIGYIYILTNKSFKDNCIKIGYSVDVERRVKDLSGSGLPYDYEIYCTYEIPASPKADKALHKLIQMLNPQLRITPNREFFDIAPEDAYKLFEQMAIIHNRLDKLKCYADQQIDEDESHKKGEYQGEIMYMTTLVKRLIGKSNGVNGPTFFKYNGIPLPEYYLKYQYKK